jgi:hypothetical protein
MLQFAHECNPRLQKNAGPLNKWLAERAEKLSKCGFIQRPGQHVIFRFWGQCDIMVELVLRWKECPAIKGWQSEFAMNHIKACEDLFLKAIEICEAVNDLDSEEGQRYLEQIERKYPNVEVFNNKRGYVTIGDGIEVFLEYTESERVKSHANGDQESCTRKHAASVGLSNPSTNASFTKIHPIQTDTIRSAGFVASGPTESGHLFPSTAGEAGMTA